MHLSAGTRREEATRKGGGEEERSMRAVYDVCASHCTLGDRAAVGVDVDTQGSSLRED